MSILCLHYMFALYFCFSSSSTKFIHLFHMFVTYIGILGNTVRIHSTIRDYNIIINKILFIIKIRKENYEIFPYLKTVLV